MRFDPASLTSETLLGLLRNSPGDQAAWNQFVERYGPKIFGWCRQWRLQEADAEDVTQNVLLRLARKLRTFAYDPKSSFRGWLRTLTEHACSDFLADAKRPELASGDTKVFEVLKSAEAHRPARPARRTVRPGIDGRKPGPRFAARAASLAGLSS